MLLEGVQHRIIRMIKGKKIQCCDGHLIYFIKRRLRSDLNTVYAAYVVNRIVTFSH